jgi:hypothetical protein
MSNPSDRVLGTPPSNTPVPEQPLPTLENLYLPTDVTPEQLFRAIGRLRKEARDEIDRLVRFLDETETHMELEPEDEADDSEAEPSLGSFERVVDQSKAWRQRGEFCSGNDVEKDEADAEPSLGSVGGMHFDQKNWASGKPNDRELDGAESGIGDEDGLQEQYSSRVFPSGLKIEGVE